MIQPLACSTGVELRGPARTAGAAAPAPAATARRTAAPRTDLSNLLDGATRMSTLLGFALPISAAA